MISEKGIPSYFRKPKWFVFSTITLQILVLISKVYILMSQDLLFSKRIWFQVNGIYISNIMDVFTYEELQRDTIRKGISTYIRKPKEIVFSTITLESLVLISTGNILLSQDLLLLSQRIWFQIYQISEKNETPRKES